MNRDYCESCGPPREAEFTVSQVIRSGRRSERRLCGTCAKNHERIRFGDTGLPLTELLHTLVIERSEADCEVNRTKVCPDCGNTIEEVEKAGEMGCSRCYTVFRAEVSRVVQELHGYTPAHGEL